MESLLTASLWAPRAQITDYLKHVRQSGKYSSSKSYDATVEYDKERPDAVEVSVYAG